MTCVVTLKARSHKVADVDVSSRGVSFASDDELLAGLLRAVGGAHQDADAGRVDVGHLREVDGDLGHGARERGVDGAAELVGVRDVDLTLDEDLRRVVAGVDGKAHGFLLMPQG